jgi:hypothetical protein
MWNSHWCCLILHMLLEYTGRIISYRSSRAEVRHTLLQRVWLNTNWGRCIVCLIELPLVSIYSHARSFWHRPRGLVRSTARISSILGMIATWADDRWGRVQLDQRIEAFHRSTCIETIVRAAWDLWSKAWIILRARSNFILFFLRRKTGLSTNSCIW